MTLRLQTFLAGLLAWLAAALLAFAPAQANPASGGYQLFERVASGASADIQLASLENFDYFAKIASECCNAPNTGASNIATAQRLADDLRLSSARSPFTPDGRLAPSAIQEGRQIIRAEDLGNPNIPAGYGKYESPTFQSPSGDFKVHYYYNPVTQDVVYDLDYKVIFNHQGNWP